MATYKQTIKKSRRRSKLIQHLGILAGVCNEIRLAEYIDQFIPQKRRTVSVGQAVQAMILNALGFTGRALYLTKRFFTNRPVETLIDPEVTADKLHDSSLGTALDSLYKYGVTEIFFYVAYKILKDQGIETRFGHLDSTTFSLHGEYNSNNEDVPDNIIHITKGYSKDNAPELNQVVVQLITTNKSNIPIWFEALSGNTSDKKSFKETIKQFQKQFKRNEMPFMVMDSAFYTKTNIVECRDMKWVSRVPETIKEVKELYTQIDRDKMIDFGNGYYCLVHKSLYAGEKQRWLLVYSEKAFNREIKTFNKNLEKKKNRNEIDLKHLRNLAFACEEDAHKAAKKFSKKLKYQEFTYKVKVKSLYGQRGRPKKGNNPEKKEYYIEGILTDHEEAIEHATESKGLFVIATNEMDKAVLSDEQLLSVYKDQSVSVERGFRFLKDPMFYAESLYLNKPERIMALTMVMTLSLLVYSLAEMKVRQTLKEKDEYIWDQKNKLTQRPTIRWVCMIFEDVLLLYDKNVIEPMNIREEHTRLLYALGLNYRKMYFL
jgi:transposase